MGEEGNILFKFSNVIEKLRIFDLWNRL